MTPDGFRRIALDMPESVESEHMDHPDFRVKGKVFATLGYPEPGWGMVKLTPEQQAVLLKADPGVFVPAKGAWGARGATTVLLKKVDRAILRRAILQAWRNVAPKRMIEELGPSS